MTEKIYGKKNPEDKNPDKDTFLHLFSYFLNNFLSQFWNLLLLEPFLLISPKQQQHRYFVKQTVMI